MAQRDHPEWSNEKRRRHSSGEVGGMLWQGLRTVFLKKNSQGFGFTLHHFIVYPPETSCQRYTDDENTNAKRKVGCQRSCLEPMDTIFVKSIKDHGPAKRAGLCTGDRLVKINGESVLGKTYSQVVTLIQNSKNILELSIMTKDQDMLQLVSAYYQDPYLKSNEPQTCKAQNSFPKPLPTNYPSAKPSCTPQQNSHKLYNPLGIWQCQPSPVTSQVETPPPAASFPTFRDTLSTGISALDFHFANHHAAITSASLPQPRKSSIPVFAYGTHCQHTLSDWYYSQPEAADRMFTHHCNISQNCLAQLGLGFESDDGSTAAMTFAEKCRKNTLLYHHYQADAASHDSYWLGGRAGISEPKSTSCSERLLAAYADYEQNYERSVETLAQASALVSPCYAHTLQYSQTNKYCEQRDQKASAGHQDKTAMTAPSMVSPGSRQLCQQVGEPQMSHLKEKEHMNCKSPFSQKASPLFQQAHFSRESCPHVTWRQGNRRSPMDSHMDRLGIGPQPKSSFTPSASKEKMIWLGKQRERISPISLKRELIPMQKLPPGHQEPVLTLCHQYTTSVKSPELPGLTPLPRSPGGTGSNRKASGSLAQHAFDSLCSIPFIGNIKGRRSSYMLAITTKRSKSCDEGLNTFREEGRVFFKLPKRVKSFFVDGSLESLQAHKEGQCEHQSTSELGTITFNDVDKEGWLQYKQILAERGKKVGGSMRPWKGAFAMLCSHMLFFYKDKQEAEFHRAGAEASQDKHHSISIHGCLIDIAYSETKRKHTLRLTTQNFCEYLLQAETSDDMLTWIQVIRQNSMMGNGKIVFSRQALINKKLKKYRKHSLTGNKLDTSPKAANVMAPLLMAKTDSTSANQASKPEDSKASWHINIMKKTKKTSSPKAFGVRLEDCQPAVNHKFVPLIVEVCCGIVEAKGLESTGIYRVPGNNAMVFNLQEHLNKGMDIDTADERWQELNVISSLLKSFFRKLPEALFMDEKYSDFIDANRIEDVEDRLKTMKKLVHDLPNHYYYTLKFLIGHLKRVADHSEKNKMQPRNLALVFGPTLVRTSVDNMTDMVTHMPDRSRIVETLILHYDWFFNGGNLNMEEKTPEEKQPVPNIDHLLSNIGRRGIR
ncbi:rho GTPase-activating protein 23-like [Parambassis ranga]|uniref:Rho GTPase-activating protein 23-like n=1 Tax=Parambassis ranga TaxID=210632 RepID=A0A6P7K9L5_9TELE|nr:rho GTPase-activating protein 23-like [Parambassis ranga]